MQQNTISCLHLSRLIIARSISFKQEASDFFSPSYFHTHLHNSGPSSARFQWWQALIFSPISILRQRYSVLAPSTRWRSSDMWRQSLISFPIPILSTAVTINFTSTQRRKKQQGIGDLLIWNFTADWVEKITPWTLFCLITFTLANLLDLMAQTSAHLLGSAGWGVPEWGGGLKLCVDQCPLLGFSTFMCMMLFSLHRLMVRGMSFSLGSPAFSPPVPSAHAGVTVSLLPCDIWHCGATNVEGRGDIKASLSLSFVYTSFQHCAPIKSVSLSSAAEPSAGWRTKSDECRSF